MKKLDLLAAVLPIGVVVMHVGGHRARPVQRNQGGHIFEGRRRQRPHQGSHGARLQLKHPNGIAPGQHLVGGGVLKINLVDVDHLTGGAFNEGQGVGDDVQIAKSQEVHLE